MKAPGFMTTSWDDGHPLDLRIAELLAKYELTGTFYVPLENTRPVMTPTEICSLSGAFEVGAHTVHHAVLTDLPAPEAEIEIAESRRRLQEITGAPCDTFCFPRGRFHSNHLDMVRRAGFRNARTVELLSTRYPIPSEGIFLLPTTVQASMHDWTIYAKNCFKRLRARNMVNAVLHARSRNWLETARAMLRLVAKRGGVFHLWGHSWEIEEQRQWPQLESLLREMNEWLTVITCMTNSRICSVAHTIPTNAPIVESQTSPTRGKSRQAAGR